jgi:hypothetical protein
MCFASQVRTNELQRDDAVDEHVSGAIDDTHSTFAEL